MNSLIFSVMRRLAVIYISSDRNLYKYRNLRRAPTARRIPGGCPSERALSHRFWRFDARHRNIFGTDCGRCGKCIDRSRGSAAPSAARSIGAEFELLGGDVEPRDLARRLASRLRELADRIERLEPETWREQAVMQLIERGASALAVFEETPQLSRKSYGFSHGRNAAYSMDSSYCPALSRAGKR